MRNENFETDYSLVTAILPQNSAKEILNNVLPKEINHAVIINARGTLYRRKWYEKLTPSVSPEQTILEVLVPENESLALMDRIAAEGNLYEGGIGAVYCIECDKALFQNKSGVPIGERGVEENYNFKKDLTGIFCIIQKDMAEEVANAAIRAGAAGPTVVFGEGHGIRDRMGLLRIAIDPEKELIRVVVENHDAEPVFEAMARQGKLHLPGRGFIYTVPISSGIVNIPGVAAGKNELATLQQIIKAIDDIKGGSNWRIKSNNNKKRKRNMLSDLTRLCCVVERGKGENLIKAAMAAGAPGVSITYGFEGGNKHHKEISNISLRKEMEILELVLAHNKVEEVLAAMVEESGKSKNDYLGIYFYTQHVPYSLTFLAPASKKEKSAQKS